MNLLLQRPDLDQSVDAGRGDLRRVGAERERRDGAHVGLDRLHVLAAGKVPDLDRLVPAAAGQTRIVGAERDGPDTFMALQLLDLFLRLDIVELDDAVERARGETLAV